MLLIALDEGSNFEKTSESKQSFVGGIVYHAKDANNLSKERGRLQNWFKTICKEQNAEYPFDLHPERDEYGNILNSEPLTRVKTALLSSLGAFLRGEKPWNWNKGAGYYDIYAIISSGAAGPHCFSAQSNFLNDNIASNRYEHMSTRVLENLLFYTPALYDDNSVSLELATRSLPVNERTKEQYLKTGHSFPATKENLFGITNADSYRGMLFTAMQQSKARTNTQYDMNVQSINYNSENPMQMYLYLADTVCSFIEKVIYTCANAEEAANVLNHKCDKLLGTHHSFVWIYREIDQHYRRALRAWENGDYYACLEEMFEADVPNDAAATHYAKHWFPWLRQQIEKGQDPTACSLALEKLSKLAQSPDYSNKKAEYILEPISKQILSNTAEDYKPLLYRMYSLQMSIANHFGKHEEALQAYNSSQAYARYISMEEHFEMRNRMTVSLLDCLDFERAKTLSRETCDQEQMLYEFFAEIIGRENEAVHYGCSLSQLGQCCAFLQQHDKAAQYFETALSYMQNSIDNRQRTLSYYLHCLIESGDQDKYAQYASDYFGSADLIEQYQGLTQRAGTAFPFALYVFTKALFVFYRHSISERKLRTFLNWIDKHKLSLEHPAESIYKYCAMLAYQLGEPQRADDYMSLADKSIRASAGSALLENIATNGREEYMRFCRGEDVFTVNDRFTYMYR